MSDKITTILFLMKSIASGIKNHTFLYSKLVERQLDNRGPVQSHLALQFFEQPNMAGSQLHMDLGRVGHNMMIMARLWSLCGLIMDALWMTCRLLASKPPSHIRYLALLSLSLYKANRDHSCNRATGQISSKDGKLVLTMLIQCRFAKVSGRRYGSLARNRAQENDHENASRSIRPTSCHRSLRRDPDTAQYEGPQQPSRRNNANISHSDVSFQNLPTPAQRELARRGSGSKGSGPHA